EKKKIPVVLLGTLNYVDIAAKAQLQGFAQLILGYRLTSSLSLGIKADFLAVGVEATLAPSDTGVTLADILIDQSNFSLNTGIRFDVVPGRLAIGFASDLIRQNSQTITFDSGLL